MYFEFMNKTKLCIGKNALDHLDYECNQYPMSHPLVLTDDVLYQLHYIDYLKKHLSLSYSLYTHIPIDSSIHIVEEIKDFYMKEKCDGIIAVGGGSVLDTAKGVCLMLCQQCDSIEDIMGGLKRLLKEKLFLFLPYLQQAVQEAKQHVLQLLVILKRR